MDNPPFWPRKSPNFMAVRVAVRQGLTALGNPDLVYVGLSGGADSLSLTAALCAETRGSSTRVHALCVDHGLQNGSHTVSENAAQQARQWGADASVITANIDKHSSEGMEAAARRARYRAFADTVDPSTPVCVGHTGDDQAESLLLSSLRGHASAMSFESHIENVWVCRPLLNNRREHTLGACTELGVDAWQDPHNEHEEFRRVAIRKQVLPILSEIIGGDAVAPLAAAGNAAAKDDELLYSLIPEGMEHSQELDCADLMRLALPVRKRTIARWLVGKDIAVTRAGIDGIDALCSDWSGQGGVAVADTFAKFPHSRLEVVRVGGKLRLLRLNAP